MALTTPLLILADNLSLPIKCVTEKLAFLGRTGSGKSYAAMKLAELMLAAHAQIGVLDPVGVWRGLRVPATKGGASFAVVVFGGLHGDVPLEPHAGALIADVVSDRGMSFVLDVSQFVSSDQQRFAKAFAERFFQRRKAQPAAVHLFMEECQEFLPQNPMGSEALTLHEFQRLWKIGRNYGIGGSLISQRPQEINKKALNMSGTLFAFQMTAPQERKAVKEWVADHAVGDDILGTLQHLEIGQCHVESPTFLKVSKTIHVRKRVTADLSSTPKVGKFTLATRALTPIDVAQLREVMATTIEHAQHNDPAYLRAEVARLQRELHKTVTKTPRPVAPPRPAITEAQIARLEKSVDRASEKALIVVNKMEAIYKPVLEQCVMLSKLLTPQRTAMAVVETVPQIERWKEQQIAAARQDRPRIVINPHEGNGHLPSGEQSILAAIAQHDGGITRERATLITGLKKSTRDTYIQRLARQGFVEVQGRQLIATPTGIGKLGPDFTPAPVGGPALQAFWLNRVPDGEAKILRVALDAYPEYIDRQRVTEITGYGKSTRDTYIQRLQRRGLLLKQSGAIHAAAGLFG